MTYFLNLKNGKASINSYRFADATATDVDDIIENFELDQCLTASIDNWAKAEVEKMRKHPFFKTKKPLKEIEDAVLGDFDFMELGLKKVGIEITDEDPSLRDFQTDFICEIREKFDI